MKQMLIGFLVLFTLLLTACQTETPAPPPTTAKMGDEFTLSMNQTVRIDEAGLTITLVGLSDQRCPLKVECVVSGPVTLVIVLQKDSLEPTQLTLQTFTDTDGRAPQMAFEGIQNSVEYEGYIIQATGVLPYPVKSADRNKLDKYQCSFVVTPKAVQ